MILSALLKIKANGKSIIQSYRSNDLSIHKLAFMTDKCSYYLHSMSQLVQCELGELTWHSALRVLACRKFVCYNSILKAESSISSVCELFLSLIIAQLSPSQVYLTPCVPPPSLPPLHASRFFIPNNLCTDPQVENTLHFHSPRA